MCLTTQLMDSEKRQVWSSNNGQVPCPWIVWLHPANDLADLETVFLDCQNSSSAAQVNTLLYAIGKEAEPIFIMFTFIAAQLESDLSFSFHCYADDTQLYLPVRVSNLGLLNSLHGCLHDVNSWMAQNFQQLTKQRLLLLVCNNW